jgi:hypothetical protein
MSVLINIRIVFELVFCVFRKQTTLYLNSNHFQNLFVNYSIMNDNFICCYFSHMVILKFLSHFIYYNRLICCIIWFLSSARNNTIYSGFLTIVYIRMYIVPKEKYFLNFYSIGIKLRALLSFCSSDALVG